MDVTQSLGAGQQERHQISTLLPRGASSLSPAGFISCKHFVMVCETQVHVWTSKFIRSWCSSKFTFRRDSRPNTWPSETGTSFCHVIKQVLGRAEVTHWAANMPNLSLENLLSLHLHRLFAEQSLAPAQACIMLISPSPSSGVNLKVLVLSQNQVWINTLPQKNSSSKVKTDALDNALWKPQQGGLVTMQPLAVKETLRLKVHRGRGITKEQVCSNFLQQI